MSDHEGHGHKAVLYKSQFPPLRHSLLERHHCIHRLINHVYTKDQALCYSLPHDSLLTQFHSMEPKTQRPQKNGRVRRNIMRTRNNAQNWEPQDVHMWETSRREPQDIRMWETSRAHQQNNWWPNNQPDTTSYLQLPIRKFQEQKRHVVNYNEEEDLSWCNKCGEPSILCS